MGPENQKELQRKSEMEQLPREVLWPMALCMSLEKYPPLRDDEWGSFLMKFFISWKRNLPLLSHYIVLVLHKAISVPWSTFQTSSTPQMVLTGRTHHNRIKVSSFKALAEPHVFLFRHRLDMFSELLSNKINLAWNVLNKSNVSIILKNVLYIIRK